MGQFVADSMILSRIRERLDDPAEIARRMRQLSERMHEDGLHMEGRPYRIEARPLIVTAAETAAIDANVRELYRAVEHALTLYAKDDEVRTLFAEYAPAQDAILDVPPYTPLIPHCRFDSVWNGGGDFRILEVNAACPSGVVQIPMATRAWLSTQWAADLLDGLPQEPYPMLADPDAFTRALLAAAGQAGYDVTAAAVVNLRGVYTNELEWLARSFHRIGLEAQICDARSMRERSTALWCAGGDYQLVYNKLDPLALLTDPAAGQYVDMLRRHRAYSVNPLVAQTIAEDKAILAVLSDPRYAGLFDAEHRAAIGRHVPWTRLMRPGVTTDPDGSRHDLLDFVARNRQRLVLKPANLTRGESVLVGPYVTDEAWAAGIRAAATDRYVVQDYVRLPSLRVPAPDAGGWRDVFVDLTLQVVSGRLAGYFSRCSSGPVVNMGVGGSLVAVVQLAAAEPAA
ncbi:hypothetical protein [Dactylosporangium sp. NPDC050588]|uniref:hypothetical protein n=1 Tax=Dactylosporangium sp. NPDC050588 TaxID=3157211 RepID=UPI0033C00CAA